MSIDSPVDNTPAAYWTLNIASVDQFGSPGDTYPLTLNGVLGADGGHAFDTGVPALVQGLVDLIDGDPAWTCSAVRTLTVTEQMTPTP